MTIRLLKIAFSASTSCELQNWLQSSHKNSNLKDKKDTQPSASAPIQNSKHKNSKYEKIRVAGVKVPPAAV